MQTYSFFICDKTSTALSFEMKTYYLRHKGAPNNVGEVRFRASEEDLQDLIESIRKVLLMMQNLLTFRNAVADVNTLIESVENLGRFRKLNEEINEPSSVKLLAMARDSFFGSPLTLFKNVPEIVKEFDPPHD